MFKPENYNPQTLDQIEKDYPNRSYTAVQTESDILSKVKRYQLIAVLEDPITKNNQGLFSQQLAESEYFDLIIDAENEIVDSILKERHITAIPLVNSELVTT